MKATDAIAPRLIAAGPPKFAPPLGEKPVAGPQDVSEVKGGAAVLAEAQPANTAQHSASTAATVAASLAGPAAAGVSQVTQTPAKSVCDALMTELGLDKLDSKEPLVISADRVKTLEAKYGLNDKQFLLALIPAAQPHADPPISQYHVGAAGMGASGAVYLGVNEEYDGNPINATTHGEQFVTENAINSQETSLKYLAVSAEPCGHCRQWLNELNGAHQLTVLVPGSPDKLLTDLLPSDFGPQDLGVKGGLMSPQSNNYHLVDAQPGDDMDLLNAAVQAANKAYVPQAYGPSTQNASGLAFRTKDGHIVTGGFDMNAAFNPSMGPGQAAVIHMVSQGFKRDDIQNVALVEMQTPTTKHYKVTDDSGQSFDLDVNQKGIDQAFATFSLIQSLNPHATFLERHIA